MYYFLLHDTVYNNLLCRKNNKMIIQIFLRLFLDTIIPCGKTIISTAYFIVKKVGSSKKVGKISHLTPL